MEETMKYTVMIIVLLLSTVLFAQNTLTFTIGEWAPYSSKTLDGYGIMPEIVTAAFKEVGIEVKYQWMPWNRALEIVKSDYNYDGTVGWGKTDERMKHFVYSKNQIVSDKQVLFHRKDYKFSWSNKAKDLMGKKVGHTRGYANMGALKTAVEKGLVMDIADSDLINFKKLVNGRIDLFDCNLYVGRDIINNKLTPQEGELLTYKQEVLSDSPLMLLVSKSHPKADYIIKKFDEGMEIIKENGVYEKIVKK